jgi:hypothetical protein
MDQQNNPNGGSQNRPASPQQAPDTARSYERAQPAKEAGMGRLDNDVATPTQAPDRQHQPVTNRQEPRQINAHEVTDSRSTGTPVHGRHPEGERVVNEPGHPSHPAGGPGQAVSRQPDHSMKDEEPLGWDQAPTDIQDPERQRQPRTGGKGGTP